MMRTSFATAEVWIDGHDGPMRRDLTSPAGWRGQNDCVVGPFSCYKAAANFIHASACPTERRVFARGDSWYVQLQPNAGQLGR